MTSAFLPAPADVQEKPTEIAAATHRIFSHFDNGLPTIVHMDMFDADNLLSAMTQPSKNLNLRRIRSEQTSGNRPKRRNPPLCSKTAIQLGENGHCGCVCAGHLHGERCLNFVLRRAASIIASAALMESSEIPPK
jgi:hypothetical protein